MSNDFTTSRRPTHVKESPAMAKKKATGTQITGDKSMKKTSKRSDSTKKKSVPKKAQSKKI
jgi:hypothetical protein